MVRSRVDVFDVRVSLPAGVHPAVVREVVLGAAVGPLWLRVSATSLALHSCGDLRSFYERLQDFRESEHSREVRAWSLSKIPFSGTRPAVALLDEWSECALRREHADALLNALAGAGVIE